MCGCVMTGPANSSPCCARYTRAGPAAPPSRCHSRRVGGERTHACPPRPGRRSGRRPEAPRSQRSVRDGLLLVVCDNTGLVSILDPRLVLPGPHREIPLRGGQGRGYEDIAADPATRRLFVLVEALPNDRPGGPPYQPAAPSTTPGPRQAGQPRPSRSTSRSTTSPPRPPDRGRGQRRWRALRRRPRPRRHRHHKPARPPSTCSSPPRPWKPHCLPRDLPSRRDLAAPRGRTGL